MPYYCLECGGTLTYDPSLKQYICKSCGLTFTFQQLVEGKDRMFDMKETSQDQKKRKQDDYLKWWLSKKEDPK